MVGFAESSLPDPGASPVVRDSSSCWEGFASRKPFSRDLQFFFGAALGSKYEFFALYQELGHAGGSFTRVLEILNPLFFFPHACLERAICGLCIAFFLGVVVLHPFHPGAGDNPGSVSKVQLLLPNLHSSLLPSRFQVLEDQCTCHSLLPVLPPIGINGTTRN